MAVSNKMIFIIRGSIMVYFAYWIIDVAYGARSINSTGPET